VSVAALGVFASASRPSSPSTRYVVTARALSPGDVVSSDDLTVAAEELSPDLASGAFLHADDVVGAVVLGPLEAGELVQRGALAAGPGPDPAAQLSFAVDADRAVDGGLVAGDRIDLLATYGSGADAFTVRVVRRALVVATAGDSSTITDSGRQVITLSLTEPDAVLAVAHAVRAGDITVVRTTGAGEDAPGRDTYSPAPASDPSP
jgi:Flp pilus assembly protein CpaB